MAVSRSTGRSLESPSRNFVSPTGTMEQLLNPQAAMSSMVLCSCSPSLYPGHRTICPFMAMPASPSRRMTARLSPPALLPRRTLRSLGSVAWTETLMGLMRSSMIRRTSRSDRLVRVI